MWEGHGFFLGKREARKKGDKLNVYHIYSSSLSFDVEGGGWLIISKRTEQIDFVKKIYPCLPVEGWGQPRVIFIQSGLLHIEILGQDFIDKL